MGKVGLNHCESCPLATDKKIIAEGMKDENLFVADLLSTHHSFVNMLVSLSNIS